TKERRLYFSKCGFLVQKLLAAKKDLRLAQELKKMNKFNAVVIDSPFFTFPHLTDRLHQWATN
ncbi:MAG: hypothetical protein WBM78_11565, partial [Desulfobacterales bacterium]